MAWTPRRTALAGPPLMPPLTCAPMIAMTPPAGPHGSRTEFSREARVRLVYFRRAFPSRGQETQRMSFFITDKCVGCSACEIVCPVDAISGVKKELYYIDPKICIDCGACGRACPYDAILDTYGDIAEKVRRTEWARPVVEEEICSGCRYCVDICPFECLSMVNEDKPWMAVA